MSARQWKPGDVAIWTDRASGEPERLFRIEDYEHNNEPAWHAVNSGFGYPRDECLRPLVVIDDQDDAQIDALCKALVEAMFKAGDRASAANGVHPATVKAALRSLTADPKPEEPTGLGAVVEDVDGFQWVRTHVTGYPWHGNLDRRDKNVTAARKYSDIAAVKVLSVGVTP